VLGAKTLLSATDAMMVFHDAGADAATWLGMQNVGEANGDLEKINKGRKHIVNAMKHYATVGNSVFRAYYWGVNRACRLLDAVNHTRNANWLRLEAEKIMEQKNWLPDDYDLYAPTETDRNKRQMFLNVGFGSNVAHEEPEPEQPAHAARTKSGAQTLREMADRFVEEEY